MYEIVLVVHLVGVVIGLGAATVSDLLFVKSLKDEKITPGEENLLSAGSLLVWVGIGIMVLSGAVMFWMNWAVLTSQSRMLAHVSIAAVIIVNGLWLNIAIAPKLEKLSRHREEEGEVLSAYLKVRKIAFVSGAVSFSSWWSVFALGIARRFVFSPPSYFEYMGLYLLIAIVAVGGALFIEKMSWQQYVKKLSK